MNLRIVFVIVGMILSIVSMVYSHACIQVVVCGTDGKTYPTPCALDAAEEKNPNLTMAHIGACKKSG